MSFLNSLNENTINLVGQDSNTKIGIAYHDDDSPNCNIRKYYNEK